MEEQNPEYLYHIYKITRQDCEDSEYTAEGPGTSSSTHEVLEPINTNLDDIAKTVLKEHLYYLQGKGYSHVAKSEDLYMSFSFNPPCHRIMKQGEIYSTHPLNEAEQDKFCSDIKEVYKSLDDIIENDGTTLD